MANPQERASTRTSAVASCSATDCVHNEKTECHAGEIRVEMSGSGAVCTTYESERGRVRP